MQNKARLDNYLILKTLGTGYTGKVKLGRDISTGNLYALKILDPTKMDAQKLTKVVKSLENELSVMQNLNHPNIVRFLGLNPSGKYVNRRGVEKTVAYAVIELASKGEIFEVLFKIGPFNENMSRFYMQQLVSAIEYLHGNHVAHRDLKPENLLLDDAMRLKLADFGFATLFTEEAKNKTKLGTERYMCPELLNKQPYSAAKADVFASGVILFIFYSGHPPFHEGRLEDPYYNVFMKSRQKFWDFHAKQNKKRVYSDSFKALVSGMLEYNPDERFSISQVRESAWMNEQVDETRALEDMAMYVQAMIKTLQQAETVAGGEATVYRNISDEQQVNGQQRGSLMHADYEGIHTDCTSIAPHCAITVHCKSKAALIDAIVRVANILPQTKVMWNDNKSSIKLKHTTEYSETVLVKVCVYAGKEGEYKVDLVRMRGPCVELYKLKAQFNELLAQHL